MSLTITTPSGITWKIEDPTSANSALVSTLIDQTLTHDHFKRSVVPKRKKNPHTFDVAYRLRMITKMIHESAVEQSVKEAIGNTYDMPPLETVPDVN